MKEVEQQCKQIRASEVLKALLGRFSAVPDYQTLRDDLPGSLATLLRCRSVLLYQRVDEALHFVAGSFDDEPGWSASLLAIAHINPISLTGDGPEASAWRERHMIVVSEGQPTLVALPLIYRHRSTGVLVALRGRGGTHSEYAETWSSEEVQVLDAISDAVALLLENTRLLERDRERIHELSLLNSISSQMNASLYERVRLKSVVIQRVHEVAAADLCELLEPSPGQDAISWVTAELREQLLHHFREQKSLAPLIIERPVDQNGQNDFLQHLPSDINTFFAFPLMNGRAIDRRWGSLLRGSIGTAQNLVQDVLQRLKELIVESMPSGLITTDRNGCIITFNRAAEAILGYHPFEVLGQPLHRFLDLQSAPSLNQTLQRMITSHWLQQHEWSGQSPTGMACSETVITGDRHGQEVVLDVDMLPLWDDQGRQVGILATFIDVTSVHRLEEEKRRLDRLASLGEMAANVAHEVRNPLASIKTVMQMLGEDLASDQPTNQQQPIEPGVGVHESIEVVLKEVERLDIIVRDLLLFARPRQLHRVRCKLTELSDRILHFLQQQCEQANVVIHRLYSEVPTALIDMAQMEQVLLNLYMNALQAMPDGGILTIACHEISCVQPATRNFASADVGAAAPDDIQRERKDEPTRWLEISVSDTGGGIPPDQIERVFQPFFTTKAHGIGLGLAITRRLIEDHGGQIQVEGHYGYGATVTVRLPLAVEEQARRDEERSEEARS
jgi:PAS domain S-box-containing protein